MIQKLYLYVNPSWRRVGIHSALMNPWWGNPYGETSLFTKQLFDTYSFDTSLYTITDDIKKAGMVFTPYTHSWLLRNDTALFNDCVQTAKDAGIPILIDGIGDVEHPVKIAKAFVLRYGGYRFIPEDGRVEIPLIADDLLERFRGGQIEVRNKGVGKPVVGFAGWTAISPLRYVRTLIRGIPYRFYSLFDERYRACRRGILWRQEALRLLSHSPLIDMRLRARESFSGTSKTAIGDMRNLQEEMVETILESDYALDVRGDANNTARLFEILSLGRIPVILDTERNFPFSDIVDYSSFALIVDFRDIEKLPEKIAEFHKNISPVRFKEMQCKAREAYVTYFRVDALMQHVVYELTAKQKKS